MSLSNKTPKPDNVDYLKQFILPNFEGWIEQDIFSALYDLNGNVIIATNKTAKSMGLLNGHMLSGLSYHNVTPEIVRAFSSVKDPIETQRIIELCDKISKIRELIVSQKIAISYIDVLPYHNVFEASLINHFPIFNKHGDVIATQTISGRFHLFGINDYLNEINDDKIPLDQKIILCKNTDLPPNLHLSKRQHEILFLLTIGVSQDVAARILHISRGTVASIVSEQLCPKFNIAGSSTRILINKALQINFNRYMPESLFRPRVIILDADIDYKYFQPQNI